MNKPPLLEEHPRSIQVLLAIVLPLLFGGLTGYFLGVSAAAYAILSVLAIVGGIGAGFDHVGPGAGAKRGVLGGTLFATGVLLAHEISGADPKTDLPHPAILLVPLFAILGSAFGAIGGWLRARGHAAPPAPE